MKKIGAIQNIAVKNIIRLNVAFLIHHMDRNNRRAPHFEGNSHLIILFNIEWSKRNQ